ncbi:MAG: hypothetical protein PVF43_06830 [Candidatus Eiseniibacteriota bacterium]
MAIGVLVAMSVVTGWSVLRDGYATYLDNPVHMAEILSLAGDGSTGWSSVASCGLPLEVFQSVLWYGGLARLVAAGLPLDLLYPVVLLIAFAAPALALYAVARRRLPVFPAACLAALLLAQRPSIVGISAAFGGVFTSHLAAAAWILLIDLLARDRASLRRAAGIAALVGFIGLTHLYGIIACVYLFAVHAAVCTVRRDGRRLARDAATALLGGLASCAYWLPFALYRGSMVVPRFDLSPAQVIGRLVLPTEINHLLANDFLSENALGYTEALPMLLLVGLGLAGAWHVLRGRRDAEGRDAGLLYAAACAGLMLLMLLVVVPLVETRVLGPFSWRFVYYVRIGLAISAIATLRAVPVLRELAPRPSRAIAAALLVVLSGLWWGRPLALQVPPPDDPELAQIAALWDWLGTHADDDWGRVYVQDTYDMPEVQSRLRQSHVLALTAHRTGVRQLGPYYRMMPYQTNQWTLGDAGRVLGRRVTSREEAAALAEGFALTNCTHVVVASPDLVRLFEALPQYRLLVRAGRFGLFRVVGQRSLWVSPAGGSVTARVEDYRTGRIAIEAMVRASGGDLLVKESFYPRWRLAGPDGASLAAHPSGLMLITGLRAGQHALDLEYRSPLPALFLVAGPAWFLIALGGLAGARRSSARRVTDSRAGTEGAST